MIVNVSSSTAMGSFDTYFTYDNEMFVALLIALILMLVIIVVRLVMKRKEMYNWFLFIR